MLFIFNKIFIHLNKALNLLLCPKRKSYLDERFFPFKEKNYSTDS